MPLSEALSSVELTYECPHCAHPLIKKGAWFKVMRWFTCLGCGSTVMLGYDDKLALFAKHAHLDPT